MPASWDFPWASEGLAHLTTHWLCMCVCPQGLNNWGYLLIISINLSFNLDHSLSLQKWKCRQQEEQQCISMRRKYIFHNQICGFSGKLHHAASCIPFGSPSFQPLECFQHRKPCMFFSDSHPFLGTMTAHYREEQDSCKWQTLIGEEWESWECTSYILHSGTHLFMHILIVPTDEFLAKMSIFVIFMTLLILKLMTNI